LTAGPLCDGVGTVVVHRVSPNPAEVISDIAPPATNGSGGLTSWRLGSLEPHEDVVIELTR